MRKIFYYTLSLLAMVSTAVSCKNEETKQVEGIEVTAMKVVRTAQVRTTPYVGKIASSRSSNIVSTNAGTLESLPVTKGDRVRKGDVIAKVSSANVNSLYAIAETTLKQARDGYDRMMKMYKDGGVTEIKKVEVESQLAKAEAAMASARNAVEKCTVKAPFDGIVEEVFVENGVEVTPMNPLVRISNISAVEVHIPVPENEIAKLRIGQEAEISVPALEAKCGATLIVKGIQASPVTHTYECVLNPDGTVEGMLPGMICKVYIRQTQEGSTVIPLDCIMTDAEGRYVWTVDEEGTVGKRRVVPDDFAVNGVVILSGLEEGDMVVTEGRRKISGGMKVKVRIEE